MVQLEASAFIWSSQVWKKKFQVDSKLAYIYDSRLWPMTQFRMDCGKSNPQFIKSKDLYSIRIFTSPSCKAFLNRFC